MDQILKRLERESRITRRSTTSESSLYVYIAMDQPISTALSSRHPRLSPNRAGLISSLRPDRPVLAYALANHVGRGRHITARALKDLERKGLLATFRLGGQTYVTLTGLGVDHPQYAPSAAAPAANAVEQFGAARIAFLQALQILGPQRTLDLTYAVDPEVFQGSRRTSGQYIQALLSEGLIDRDTDGGGHHKHCLTDRGAVGAHLLGLALAPPSREALLEAARERWEARRSIQRTASRRRQAPSGVSPHQLCVLGSGPIDVMRPI